jgi:hypothetical protein
MSGPRFLLDGRAVAAADAVLGAETGLVRSGEGWFETLRCEQGRWMFEGEHLARMEASVAAAGLDAGAALQAARATLQAASSDAARTARLRLLVTPSPAVDAGWQALGELADYAPRWQCALLRGLGAPWPRSARQVCELPLVAVRAA